jgi:hypothetical protein
MDINKKKKLDAQLRLMLDLGQKEKSVKQKEKNRSNPISIIRRRKGVADKYICSC